MIKLELNTILTPKHIIEAHFKGGLNAYKQLNHGYQFEEDEYLCASNFYHATGVAEFVETLIANGLEFDEMTNSSNHFTVVAKEGIWWTTNWLITRGTSAYFIADVNAPI
jgi:hypothetical protein